ncbi:MAG TPA: NADH-quinone oxidoreductase subunit J [Terriglobales bacterium]|nr:NADH-quinone oxidoreductase subunit J [Terriglobales bacterium]
MLHLILFLIFAAFCAGGALNMLIQRHPINSALSLIVVMVSLAMLYLLLGAEFVAAIQVIVYAGAIMVLFVFVIMLLNAGEEEHTKGSRVALMFGFPALLVGAGVVVYTLALRSGSWPSLKIGQFHGTAEAISDLLFKNFLLPFEVTSVLILIAIMGAVLLARKGGTE